MCVVELVCVTHISSVEKEPWNYIKYNILIICMNQIQVEVKFCVKCLLCTMVFKALYEH